MIRPPSTHFLRVLPPGPTSLSTCFTSWFQSHVHDPSTILASVLCTFLRKWSCPLPYCSHTLQDHTKCLLITKSSNASTLVSCTPLRNHHLPCASSHPLAPWLQQACGPPGPSTLWSYHFPPHNLLPPRPPLASWPSLHPSQSSPLSCMFSQVPHSTHRHHLTNPKLWLSLALHHLCYMNMPYVT